MNVLSSSASSPLWRVVCLAALCWLVAVGNIFAQEGNAPAPSTGHPAASVVEAPTALAKIEAAEQEKAHSEGLPAASPVLFKIGPLPVNSSMILTWVIALGVILFARYATRNMQEVPGGAQNFWEWLVESLRNFLESIIGRDLTRRAFWFFATVFIFILFTNWFGLLPGVGTIGWGIPNAQGDLTHIARPLLRGANADLNMTLAMSLIFFACWFYWALTTNGIGGFLMHIFGPKGETKGIVRVMMIVIFALVGVLEVVSILFRPVISSIS